MSNPPLFDKACEAQAAALRDFGYPDVTPEMVRERHTKWKTREDQSGDIIAMFCIREFDDRPEFFGEQDPE